MILTMVGLLLGCTYTLCLWGAYISGAMLSPPGCFSLGITTCYVIAQEASESHTAKKSLGARGWHQKWNSWPCSYKAGKLLPLGHMRRVFVCLGTIPEGAQFFLFCAQGSLLEVLGGSYVVPEIKHSSAFSKASIIVSVLQPQEKGVFIYFKSFYWVWVLLFFRGGGGGGRLEPHQQCSEVIPNFALRNCGTA